MEKGTILIVDDEPRYIQLIAANLVVDGFEVVEALDGETAVEIVSDQEIDLVLQFLSMVLRIYRIRSGLCCRVAHHLTGSGKHWRKWIKGNTNMLFGRQSQIGTWPGWPNLSI